MTIYPPARSRVLDTTAGHVNEFGKFFNDLRSRWVKVERLQHYDESDFDGYVAFLDGNYEEAQRKVKEMVKGQDDVYSVVQAKNLSMKRVRIFDLPLSGYLLNYEIAAYEADIECGEDIRFVDAAEIQSLLSETGISDYVLFDEERVVALIYDEVKGTLKQAVVSEDADVISRYVKLTEELLARSTPMLEHPVYRALNR